MVRDHDGERDRLDDHHRRRGGETAEEGDQRDGGSLRLQGQREDGHVPVDVARREQDQPCKDERHDEEIDEDEVEREQPTRPLHVVERAGLDDGHVELARQQQGRECGKERQRGEGADA